MSIYGNPVYAEAIFGGDSTEFDNWLRFVVDAQPPSYRPAENRDFLERFLKYPALDLAIMRKQFRELADNINPATASEEWLDWMLHEWWGFHLIPANYPIDRKRRLLANLNQYFKQRYTRTGIIALLREFGIVAEIYDRRLFVGGFLGSYGVAEFPLRARIRVLYFEPFFFPRHVYVGGFIGASGTHLYTTQQIITESFVMALVHWSRVAGCEFTVEFIAASQSVVDDAPIPDDDEVVAA